ncbi:MAG: FAD-binding protein [Alcanivoracaceae bacterium]|nr:FAD-binding protein [Alcanivoracaceae bacterium]
MTISLPALLARSATLVLLVMSSGCYWENWTGTESVEPEYLVQPENAAQLVDYVGRATRAGKRVRMTGSGHSASEVAITREVLFTPEKLNKPLQLDRRRLRDSDDPALARVMSGITVKDLNAFLDARGRALINMGGYDGQTIAGVMMTATHGSGLDYGPMADQIVSLQVVGEGGRMMQIEPDDGITNPATWPGYLEENSRIPVQLIQDDDAFNAARVAIGSMGVVYAVTLTTDRKFWLREVRWKTTWEELTAPGGAITRLLAGQSVYADRRSPEHFELQYSPYANDAGTHTVLVTERHRSYDPLPEQPQAERGQPGTEFVSGLITVFEKPLAWILSTFPGLARTILETTLDTQQDDNFTNVSYKVFNIGVVNYTDAIAIEAAFDLQDTVAAIERSFVLAESLFAQGIPHTGPIAVRFVKSTDNFIAMQQGRDSMFMEVIMLSDTNGSQELLKAYQRTMRNEFSARPHWGLDLKLLQSEAEAWALYPKWNDWMVQYRRFNRGTFDGKVTDRLGISVRPR